MLRLPQQQQVGLFFEPEKDGQMNPKRPVGRPRTILDMKAYKAAKAREYRAKKKEG